MDDPAATQSILVRIKWIAGAANDSTNDQRIDDPNEAEDNTSWMITSIR